MEPNWDLDNAPAPIAEFVKRAKRFCHAYVSSPEPGVSATAEGGVNLEWHVDGRTLEIDFSPCDGTIDGASYICWETGRGLVDEGVLIEPTNSNEVMPYSNSVLSLISWVRGA
jgi:hypothetical protein